MPQPDVEPLTDTLRRLGDEYRRLQQDHQREGPDGATRNGLEQRMEDVAVRFARMCAHWVHDEALRDAWTHYFHEGGTPPEGPPRSPSPPEFKGVTEAGSRVELRRSEDGGYDVIVDGAVERHEQVPWHLEPDILDPVQIGEHSCREVFDVPGEALAALERFRTSPNTEPPWRWARVLYDEGLVDHHFALTPRGRRALPNQSKQGSTRTGTSAGTLTFGVLVADAARARLFVLGPTHGEFHPTLEPLVEIARTIRPEARARDSELLSNTRPGLRREGAHGPRHAVSDRRDSQRRADAKRFAQQIVEETARQWRARNVTRAILAASPKMLGLLRPALARHSRGPTPWSLQELDRDLSRLAAPALHDALAGAGVLPPRGRLPPTLSSTFGAGGGGDLED